MDLWGCQGIKPTVSRDLVREWVTPKPPILKKSPRHRKKAEVVCCHGNIRINLGYYISFCGGASKLMILGNGKRQLKSDSIPDPKPRIQIKRPAQPVLQIEYASL